MTCALGRILIGASRPVSCSTLSSLSEPTIKEVPKTERSSFFMVFLYPSEMEGVLLGNALQGALL
jgi:hypothetical protein